MKFWDSSALVPLLVSEPSSGPALDAYARDPEILVWWGTPVELVSAIARLEREGSLETASVGPSLRRLDGLAQAWREVQPTDAVRVTATRLLRVHPLRAADALQLAASLVASEGRPPSLPFLTLDERLADAAEREGFPVSSVFAG